MDFDIIESVLETFLSTPYPLLRVARDARAGMSKREKKDCILLNVIIPLKMDDTQPYRL